MAVNETATPAKLNIFQRNYFLQAWLGIVLALASAVALALVQAYLGPLIEANKVNETRQRVPELLVGKEQAGQMAAENRQLDITVHSLAVEKNGRKKIYSVYEARDASGQTVGWVTKAAGQGYADLIELLLGLDAGAQTISGLFVLDQKETPGLGNKIIDQAWRDQFRGKPAGQPLAVVKGHSAALHEIDAITGATISSRSVVDIVNTILHDLRPQLSALTTGERKE